MSRRIGESELILNADGSVYHLHLKPGDVAETIILVGDQGRVEKISSFFERVELKVQNREFITHTGFFKGKRMSVISTGIGTDNIDIVLNELDALFNIDLKNRVIKSEFTSLNLVRIGTSGALQEDLEVESPLVSHTAVGFDSLLNFYAGRDQICELDIEQAFKDFTGWHESLPSPYFVPASQKLFDLISPGMASGITVSAPGFYAPQGRTLRLGVRDEQMNEKIRQFRFQGKRITNFEMESSAIFGLSKLLGHHALTVCEIIANRYRKQYSSQYSQSLQQLIQTVLEKLRSL